MQDSECAYIQPLLEQPLPSFPVFYECWPVAGMLDQPAGVCFSIAITRPSGSCAATGVNGLGAVRPESASIDTDSTSQPIDRRTLSKQDAVESSYPRRVERFGHQWNRSAR
jgi:hypothetical protein